MKPPALAPVAAEPIAVIGMSGCFPQAPDIETLWDNLKAGRDSIGELPASRWGGRAATALRHAGVLEEVECFDPLFFGISPREAQAMDPHQRLLMQCVYRTIEDAGYSVQSLSGSDTALLVGTAASGYGESLAHVGAEVAGYTGTGLVGSVGPNRMSYWLNWHGPSEPVETACSSSLVAIHRAVGLLRSGECAQAVAGGVNALLWLDLHSSFAQAGMLSPRGRCQTFSAQADGYVRGEGAGMLFLKPLSAAERDGDHIYGLIVGSAQNHGGRANSLTAPSWSAQSQLIKNAFLQAGVDPRTVGYVEAHGTGTPLGDPIEVHGLKRAFRSLARGQALAPASCGLGTIKSNIGHLELAAGVAGMIKVLMQLKHRYLVKSLHSEPRNPHIDLSDSPFYVVNENRSWDAPLDAQGRELPRRAGVSSFGFGGVNAHVVLEEYQAPAREVPLIQGPVAILLSARNEDRLQARTRQLHAYLARYEVNLADLAYTLQVGREALDARLALVVGSMEELQRKLASIGQGDTSPEGAYRGEIKRDKEKSAAFTTDEDAQRTIEAWIAERAVGKLAELWTQGVVVNWDAVYAPTKPRRISLPTYPFASERHWVPESRAGSPAASAVAAASESRLHPLVHSNTSSLREHRYTTTLTGDEFYLVDHVAQGRPMVPSVVQLEWARAAVSLALDDAPSIGLEQVTWPRQLVVDAPLEVHVTLTPEDDGRISYKLYSGSGDAAVVYSRGWAAVKAPCEAPRVDIADLEVRCDLTLTGAQCNAGFASMGLHYGPSLEAFQELPIGSRLAVGTLQRSYGVKHEGHVWPPSVLASALEASLGLSLEGAGMAVPFALHAAVQWGEVPASGWAIVRPAAGDGAAVRKLDVAIADADGRLAVQLLGLSVRIAGDAAPDWLIPPTPSDTSLEPSPELVGELTLAPVWDISDEVDDARPDASQGVAWVGADAQAPSGGLVPNALTRSLLFTASDGSEVLIERLRAAPPWEHMVWQVPVDEPSAPVMGLRLIRALLALGYGVRTLHLTVLTRQAQAIGPHETADPMQASVHGLIGSLAMGYPHWRVRLLDLPPGQDLAATHWRLQPSETYGNARVWRSGRWHRPSLLPCQLPEVARPAFRDGGVYVVLGGAGGIGVAFSEYLIRRYRAQLVWLGRRPNDEVIARQCARLGALGPSPLYLQADATDREALEAARATTRQRFGMIHGVVHAAVVQANRPLADMDDAAFDAGMSAKTTTTVNLDAVFGPESLDFLVFFSSVQSFFRAPGTSNYAAGCFFIDAFASGLHDRPYPVKVMHWGYWGSVGIAATLAYRERMALVGMGSIEPPEAMAALERLLAGPMDRVAFVKTLQGGAAHMLGINDRSMFSVAPSAPSVTLAVPPTVTLPEAVGDAQAVLGRQLGKLLWAQLSALGWLDADAEPPVRYARWREAALRFLSLQGMALDDPAPEWKTQWAQWETYRELVRDDAVLGAQVRLVDATLRALPAVLRGERAATEVLFPQGQLSLVEGIYRDHPVADHFNAAMAERLDAYVRARLFRDPQATLRILEVGAGTGGTSEKLFARLAPHAAHIAEYCYTDVSAAFLLHAQKRYASEVPYLRTLRLDIERPPAAQGFKTGGYDVVVAANVLHATRNIRHTLRQTKTLLKRNGLLLLNELADASVFTHLTFGLLDGWWVADDQTLRLDGSPGLSPAGWAQVLKAEGFEAVHTQVAAARALGQQIVVASSNGVMRLERETVATPQAPTAGPALSSSGRGNAIWKQRTDKKQDAPLAQIGTSAPGPGYRAEMNGLGLEQCVEWDLIEQVHQLLQLPREAINPATYLNEYGLDSILSMDLASSLSEHYKVELEPALLFSHPSLGRLAAYLLEQHGPALEAFYRAGDIETPAKSADVANVGEIRSLPERKRLFDRELKNLDEVLRPVASMALAARLATYAGPFRFAEDASGNLWIFIQTGSGNILDLAASRALLGIFTAIRDFADFTRTKFVYLSHRDKDFSLGGHRKSFAEAVQRGETGSIVEMGQNFRSTLDILAELPCIVVGIAYGNAQGGGMELLMLTDLQFVWPGLKVGFPEVRSGLYAGFGGVSYVSSVIHPARALRLNLTGELISSETAAAYGLISHLSESPFSEALALQDADFDLDAALAVRKVIVGPKYELFKKDIEAWVGFICGGTFLARQDKISVDFDVIDKVAEKRRANHLGRR